MPPGFSNGAGASSSRPRRRRRLRNYNDSSQTQQARFEQTSDQQRLKTGPSAWENEPTQSNPPKEQESAQRQPEAWQSTARDDPKDSKRSLEKKPAQEPQVGQSNEAAPQDRQMKRWWHWPVDDGNDIDIGDDEPDRENGRQAEPIQPESERSGKDVPNSMPDNRTGDNMAPENNSSDREPAIANGTAKPAPAGDNDCNVVESAEASPGAQDHSNAGDNQDQTPDQQSIFRNDPTQLNPSKEQKSAERPSRAWRRPASNNKPVGPDRSQRQTPVQESQVGQSVPSNEIAPEERPKKRWWQWSDDDDNPVDFDGNDLDSNRDSYRRDDSNERGPAKDASDNSDRRSVPLNLSGKDISDVTPVIDKMTPKSNNSNGKESPTTTMNGTVEPTIAASVERRASPQGIGNDSDAVDNQDRADQKSSPARDEPASFTPSQDQAPVQKPQTGQSAVSNEEKPQDRQNKGWWNWSADDDNDAGSNPDNDRRSKPVEAEPKTSAPNPPNLRAVPVNPSEDTPDATPVDLSEHDMTPENVNNGKKPTTVNGTTKPALAGDDDPNVMESTDRTQRAPQNAQDLSNAGEDQAKPDSPGGFNLWNLFGVIADDEDDQDEQQPQAERNLGSDVADDAGSIPSQTGPDPSPVDDAPQSNDSNNAIADDEDEQDKQQPQAERNLGSDVADDAGSIPSQTGPHPSPVDNAPQSKDSNNASPTWDQDNDDNDDSVNGGRAPPESLPFAPIAPSSTIDSGRRQQQPRSRRDRQRPKKKWSQHQWIPFDSEDERAADADAPESPPTSNAPQASDSPIDQSDQDKASPNPDRNRSQTGTAIQDNDVRAASDHNNQRRDFEQSRDPANVDPSSNASPRQPIMAPSNDTTSIAPSDPFSRDSIASTSDSRPSPVIREPERQIPADRAPPTPNSAMTNDVVLPDANRSSNSSRSGSLSAKRRSVLPDTASPTDPKSDLSERASNRSSIASALNSPDQSDESSRLPPGPVQVQDRQPERNSSSSSTSNAGPDRIASSTSAVSVRSNSLTVVTPNDRLQSVHSSSLRKVPEPIHQADRETQQAPNASAHVDEDIRTVESAMPKLNSPKNKTETSVKTGYLVKGVNSKETQRMHRNAHPSIQKLKEMKAGSRACLAGGLHELEPCHTSGRALAFAIATFPLKWIIKNPFRRCMKCTTIIKEEENSNNF